MEQVRIARSRVLAASWFDYPQYYDIAFQAYSQHEANFIYAACRMPKVLSLRRRPVAGAGLRQWPTNHRVGGPRLPGGWLRYQSASVELSSAAFTLALVKR